MLTIFEPTKREKKKAVVAELNQEIKEIFERTFSENYQDARNRLIESGIAEDNVDAKLNQIKAKLEQKMIIEANQLLREEVLKVAREEMEASQKRNTTSCKLSRDVTRGHP